MSRMWNRGILLACLALVAVFSSPVTMADADEHLGTGLAEDAFSRDDDESRGPRCGDGRVDPGEECDDGAPANPNDGCDAACRLTTWTASLVSGNGPSGGDPRALALHDPQRIARDAFGNIYIADTQSRRVLRVFPSGLVATIAGKGGPCSSAADPCGDGGPADEAGFGFIEGIAVDSQGHVYVSERYRHRVRKINAFTRNIETVVNVEGVGCPDRVAVPACGDGGTAGAATIDRPVGLDIDSQDRLYIADIDGHRIRRVWPHPLTGAVEATSTIETVAGNGTACLSGGCGDGGLATDASMSPWNVAVIIAGAETRLYIADPIRFVERVREVIVGGSISAFAGAPDEAGDLSDCIPATEFQLQQPNGVALDREGNVFIADIIGIYRVDRSSRIMCQVAEVLGPCPRELLLVRDGEFACDACLYSPTDLLIDPATGDLIIADAGHNRVRRVAAHGGVIHDCRDPESVNNTIHTLVGSGEPGVFGDGNPADATAMTPQDIAIDESGAIHFSDWNLFDLRGIRRIDPETGVVTTKFRNGTTLAFDSFGNLYFVDSLGTFVGMVDAEGSFRTVAGRWPNHGFSGDGGPATSALLDFPQDLAFDVHNNLYILDWGNDRIRRVNAVGGAIIPGVSTITTVVGGGTNQDYGNPAGLLVGDIRLPSPRGLAITPEGTLYFTEHGAAYRVFELPNAHLADVYVNNTQRVKAIAGSGTRCGPPGSLPPGPTCGDFGPALLADLRAPDGLAYDPATGDLFLSDSGTNRVKRLRLDRTEGRWYIEPVAGNSQVVGGGRFFGDGGPARDAGLNGPSHLALDRNHDLLIDDVFNFAIRKVDSSNGFIYTVAGAVFPAGDRELNLSALSSPMALTRLRPDLWLVADLTSRRVRAVDLGWTGGRENSPDADRRTGLVYSVAGYRGGFAEDGAPARYSRRLASPSGVAYDGKRYVYVTERDNHVVRRIDTRASPWIIETWLGTEGVADTLNRPGGLAIDRARSVLYVADTGNHVVRSVDLRDSTKVQTIAGLAQTPGCPAGSGNAAGDPATLLTEPVALAMGQSGNDSLYVVDAACHMVRRINFSSVPARSNRVIGIGASGNPRNDIAGSVPLRSPCGATVDSFGNLHVTSRNTVVTVASGRNRIAEMSDPAFVIYGADPKDGFEPYTDCLTGISMVNPGDGKESEMFLLDRCLGFMLKLRREGQAGTPVSG